MKTSIYRALAVAVCFLAGAGLCPAKPRVESFTLESGIQVLSIHLPDSNNVSIFTFLPMGLGCDGAGRAQWSHLIEHLTIRTTVPGGSREANAETLPDHMRLDFYGTVDNWREGLSHHARWLEGTPFTAESLRAEKRAVNRECDFVAQRQFTHKFAMAAWGQGYRHGLSHAAIKGDVVKAELGDVQDYRDRRLAVADRILICVVGGIDCGTLRPAISTEMGKIRLQAKAVEPVELHPGNRTLTWDVNARHLMLTWPIPACSHADYPALLVARQWLTMKLFSDSQIKKATGMTLAGADLGVPEGTFFYVSASLKPDAAIEDVRKSIERHLQSLRSAAGFELPMIAGQLSLQLTNITDPKMLRGQTPANVSDAMVEGNIGLQWATREYRYGPARPIIAKRMATLKARDVQLAAAKYLSPEKCSVCSIEPGPQ
ncbi:MAG: insulinase family protein [Phycisphaerales bacterium]|nr:MAG: insulinase family protein [Phycisphaerales bacterium]